MRESSCSRAPVLPAGDPALRDRARIPAGLVRLWVGPACAAAAGLAVVGLVYIAMTAPIQVGSNLLVGTGRAVLRTVIGAVVVNLVASIVLVHLVGTVGRSSAP